MIGYVIRAAPVFLSILNWLWLKKFEATLPGPGDAAPCEKRAAPIVSGSGSMSSPFVESSILSTTFSVEGEAGVSGSLGATSESEVSISLEGSEIAGTRIPEVSIELKSDIEGTSDGAGSALCAKTGPRGASVKETIKK